MERAEIPNENAVLCESCGKPPIPARLILGEGTEEPDLLSIEERGGAMWCWMCFAVTGGAD